MTEYTIALQLSSHLIDSDFRILVSQLSQYKFETILHKNHLNDSKILFLSCSDFEIFLKEAESLKIIKPKFSKKSRNIDYIEKLPKDKYYYFLKERETLDPRIKTLELSSSFNFLEKDRFIPYNTLSKTSSLVNKSNEDSQLITQRSDIKEISKSGIGKETLDHYIKLFTSEEILRITHSILLKVEMKDSPNSILSYYEEREWIEEIIPLHSKSEIDATKNIQKIEKLKEYLGENCAIYFYFLDFMQKWLIVPTIIGIIVVIFNKIFKESVDESPYESLYSGFMVIWAASFAVSWEKKQREIAHEWGCFGKSFERASIRQTHQDKLDEKKDPVTGLMIKYYPSSKRALKYLESFLITLPILLITLILLVLSLNLRGYVDKNHKSLYIQWLSSFSDEGALFDKNTNMAFIPTIIHVIMLFVVNMMYSTLSHWTTRREVHKTVHGFENAMIVKRVIFETFNTFTDLCYIAFVRLDINSLKTELISIYMVDELRRVFTETVIPLIIKKINQRKTNMKVKPFEIKPKEKNEAELKEQLDQYLNEKMIEITLPKYEPFDDYLEVIINFAYITLFASAFPLAPLLIFVFHWMESASDKYKILHTYRRPMPERANGIGSWLQVLNIISLLSVLSNLVLFAFSSDKMAEFFPFLFRIYKKHVINAGDDELDLFEADPKKGMGRYVVLIVFALEHIFFIGIWLVRRWVLNQEDWTNIYRKRKEYKSKLSKKKINREITLNTQ